jgi:hypothetical protein
MDIANFIKVIPSEPGDLLTEPGRPSLCGPVRILYYIKGVTKRTGL